MSSITKKLQINAPKEKVWEALADLGGVYKYSATVVGSNYTSDEKIWSWLFTSL